MEEFGAQLSGVKLQLFWEQLLCDSMFNENSTCPSSLENDAASSETFFFQLPRLSFPSVFSSSLMPPREHS
jgi:hypothetical protein